jgi:hypothetical protein
MNDKRIELSPRCTNTIRPEDIFSQVIGSKRNGQIRMCGGGIAPSDIWGDIPTHSTHQLIMADQREKISRLEEQVREESRMLVEIHINLTQNNNNLSNVSRIGLLESNQLTSPTNNASTLRLIVSIIKRT